MCPSWEYPILCPGYCHGSTITALTKTRQKLYLEWVRGPLAPLSSHSLGHTTPGGTLPQISLDGEQSSSLKGKRPLVRGFCPSPFPLPQYTKPRTRSQTTAPIASHPSSHPQIPGVIGHRQRFGLVLQQHPSGPRFLLLYLVSGQTLTQLRCALFFEPPLQSRPACPSPDPQALSGHCSAVLVLYLSNLHPPLPSYRRHDRSRLHSCTTNDMLSLPL